MPRILPFVAVCLLLGSTTAHADRTRLEFARAISKLKEGVAATDVTRLLGPPDDVRTQHDPGGICAVDAKEVWRYGTSGHLTTATLGEVYINEKDRVQYVFGRGEPRVDRLPDERQLRPLLDILGQVSSYNAGASYNPRTVIRAVNALLPLGKEKALATIEEFLRVASDWHNSGRDGVFLVLRTLFDVPNEPGYMPEMFVGAPSPPEPKDRKRLPRFPIAIEGDIPLLIVDGYSLAGLAEQPEPHVRYFREHGTLRAEPLVPAAEPFKVLDQFAKSRRWIFRAKGSLDDERRGRHMLGNQLLRLMDTVYRTEPDEYGDLLPWGRDAAGVKRAEKILADASKLKIRWDGKSDQYTFLDGTTLPEPKRDFYRRETWKPTAANLDVALIVERTSPRYVSIEFAENVGLEKAAYAVITVYDAKAKGKVLAKFVAEGNNGFGGGTGTRGSWQTVELPAGREIRAELTIDGKAEVGPTIKP
jgi:hypothetical protein